MDHRLRTTHLRRSGFRRVPQPCPRRAGARHVLRHRHHQSHLHARRRIAASNARRLVNWAGAQGVSTTATQVARHRKHSTLTMTGVEEPSHHHRSRARRPLHHRRRRRLRRHQKLGLQTRRPLPNRRRPSVPTTLTTTQHHPHRPRPHRRRPHLDPPRQPHRPRPRRRPHHSTGLIRSAEECTPAMSTASRSRPDLRSPRPPLRPSSKGGERGPLHTASMLRRSRRSANTR